MSLRALARELGVSATAASLALKNSDRVSTALRDKARRLAKARGYIPNARLAEMMSEVRRSHVPGYRGALGLISLFPEERPWIERPLWSHLGVILDGARQTAASHGYALEQFWFKAPRMTARRLGQILETRGIQGIFCLGSLDPEETLPAALTKFAVVTQGATIPGSIHRVLSDFTTDARVIFDQLLARGYRRPGFVMQNHADRRTDYLYSAAFLGHQERFFQEAPIPIYRRETWDKTSFSTWFRRFRPDVIVLHHDPDFVTAMESFLAGLSLSVPRDVGLAVLDRIKDRKRYSGICQDPHRIGAIAVEMLIGRVLLHDFGTPVVPKIELVRGSWNEGLTLRPRQ